MAKSQTVLPLQGSNPPGMTWDSLVTLPNLLNAQWLPIGTPKDEMQWLKTMALPPLKPEFLDEAKAQIVAILQGKAVLPTANCRREGQPRLAWYPYPLQFMYGAGNVMIREAYQVRQVSVGGINHPTDLGNPENSLAGLMVNGDVSGVWEGSTLVVDTIAVRDDVETFYGVPNDPDLHVVERYRLLNSTTLERQTTVDAPNWFTKPWVVRTTYRRHPAGSLASHFCEPESGGLEDNRALSR